MSGLAGFAAKLREVADLCETSLATEACREGARDYLAVLRAVTPKRSGALADSETVTGPSGGGTHAVAEIGPHIRYAAFRETGGTIDAHYGEVWKTPKGGTKARMYRHTLHWEGGGFPLHVTQAGAHYMEKARGPGGAAFAQACAITAARVISL